MPEQLIQIKERLISIDALRGLAIFLILSIDIGGAPVLPTFAQLWGEEFGNLVSDQFSYASTEGLRICFLAMPMFLFVVGLVIPFSMSKRHAQQPNAKTSIYLHIIKRSLILFLLGLIAGGHLLDLKFATMPLYNNVLEYIGIGYFVCAIIVLNTTWSFQLILTAGLLVAYWLAFVIIPVPGSNAGVFSSHMNLAIYIDNILLGPFHKPGSWQVLATINFIANMLLGVLMGQILNHALDKKYKAKLLVACGFAMLLAGLAWATTFPIIRNLWTSSFVLVTCGMTTLVLGAFYLIIDVLGYQKWAFIFVVLGVNSIAIYMMAHMFDFKLIGNVVVGGASRLFAANVREFIQASAAMTVMWLILFWMYRTKSFIKI
jgi:predicted acyltransferase